MNDPLLAVDYPAGRVTPVWGIGAILGLVGLLGVVLYQRLSEEDRSWTRWEKHELTGVVLGQNPVQESAVKPEAPAAARRSADVPQWAQANSTPRAARGTGETSPAAPTQQEVSGSDDPFAASPAPHSAGMRNDQSSAAEAPRRLFQEERSPLSQNSPLPIQGERPTATPRSLDFAVSSADRRMDEERQPTQARYQRVQQAAATDESAESLFPGPAPAGQMPIQSVGGEGNGLPTVERLTPPSGIPSAPNELSLDPIPSQVPVAPPQQPSGFEPQPTMSLPEASPRQIPSLPQPNMIPAQPLQREATGLPQLDSSPAFSATPAPQQVSPARQFQMQPPNEPIPRAGISRPTVSMPAAPPAATVKQDEVYQVQPGDNYWTISRRYYGSARFFSSLAEYNKHRIPAPEKMKPGMYVLVPDVEVLHQRYPQLTGGGPRDPAETAPPGFFVDASGQPCYRVGKGDTLTDIAQTYLGRSSRWVQIQGMNQDRLENGKALKIGLVLRLPADASQVVLAPADSENR